MNASNLFGVASPTHIVAVGRLVPAKGFDLLIRAMTYCDASIRLTLVGDGPERRALETLVRDLGLPDRVTFCGERSHADVLRLMATALLVAIPSRQDSFGLVALEALAVGRPVVATHVGGLPEVLQGTEAILVEPDNPTALAEAIRSLIARLVREPNFGARNREFATRFSTARMTDQYVQAYRDSR
jgi:glycosyltransferase involved in cell wall biosynthesis